MTRTSITTDTADAPSVGLWEIAYAFVRISCFSFGGGLTAWAQRILVDEKKWLDIEEFLGASTLCRVMPGANQINMAVYLGGKLRGAPGAVAAILGLLLVPSFIILGLSFVYFHFQNVEAFQNALRGASAAAVGLTLALGFKNGGMLMKKPMAVFLMAAIFLAYGVFRFKLLPVLALSIPLAILWAMRDVKAEEEKESNDGR